MQAPNELLRNGEFFMLKVIISDDEVKVIQLIRYLVSWDQFDMQIAGTANDGQKALELICAEKPDIVITDIRMPSIDGIQLIQRTLELGIHPFFIIISGYGEFAYAQKAISLGVEDYLLKPLKRKELEAVLLKIQKKYQSRQQIAQKESFLLSQLNESQEKIKNNLLTELLINKNSLIPTMDTISLQKEYGCSFTEAVTELLVLHIFTGSVENTTVNSEERGFLLPKLEKELKNRLAPFCADFICTQYKENVICLINRSQQAEEQITSALLKLKISILGYQNIYPDMRISVGVSSISLPLSDFDSSYQEAQTALLDRFNRYDQFLLIHHASGYAQDLAASLITSQDQRELISCIELIDIPDFTKKLEEIRRHLLPYLSDGSLVYSCYSKLAEIFLFGIKSYNSGEFSNGLNMDFLLSAFDHLFTFDEIYQWFSETCKTLLIQYSEGRKTLENKPIRLAKQYIMEHYNETITLEIVSREIGFNPAYFSTVFLKSTGQHFMDYLKEVRISNAKTMLLNTNKSIAEIASAVGYSDLKYFSRLFRKLTHLTPSEYRKLYG